MNKKLRSLGLCLSMAISTQAQTIAAWNFTGKTGSEVSVNATTFSANLVSTKNALTRGAGASGSVAGDSFRSQGFANDGIALTNTDFFQITLQATTGNKLSLSNINAKFQGTASYVNSPGVNNQFAYSLDNGTTFNLIGSPVNTTQPNTTGRVDLPEQSLTAVTALQNVPSTKTIILRYFASGATPSGGWGFYSSTASNNGLTIGGTIVAGTPPSFAANFPAVDNVDQTKFDVFSNIDAVGNTYYVVISDGVAAPTATQVSLGQDASGAIATISGSFFNEVAGTTYSKNVTGLSADVAYDVYFVAKDLSDNLSDLRKIDIKTSETPLPIQLTAFSGDAVEKTIRLNWNTASELNNNYFDIQHSADGKNFRSIGNLKGAGTSNSSKDYSFVDENPNAGVNYYQLVQYDFDGKISTSFIVGLNSKIAGSQLNVFVGDEQLKVFISSANQTSGKLQVCEIGGRQLFSEDISLDRGYNSINLPFSVQPGVHFVRFTSDSENLVKKFLR